MPAVWFDNKNTKDDLLRIESDNSSHDINNVSTNVCFYDQTMSKNANEEILDVEQILADKTKIISKGDLQLTDQGNDLEKGYFNGSAKETG